MDFKIDMYGIDSFATDYFCKCV